MRAGPAVASLAILACLAAPARANGPVDWNALADTGTIQIVTTDPDGSPRETTVWLAVWKGQGYVRSSGTRWLGNVERNPDVLVRAGGADHPLRAVRVPDSETREAVTAVFREKYGFSDVLTGVYRGLFGTPTIMRLEPRTSLAPID